MLRIFVIGLWVCIVALGTSLLGFKMNAPQTEVTSSKDAAANIQYDRTSVFSVPIMVDNRVDGYIVSQLIYTIDANEKAKLKVPLSFFINDEIFRVFFGSYSDTRKIAKVKFDDVKNQIIDGVNQRFAEPVLKDLLVAQFNYISADTIRAMNNTQTNKQ